ncbi:DUF1173 family protein [Nocardia sp. NPDC004582]
MEYTDWVRLDGRRLPLVDVRADPDEHVRLLAAARAHKSAECLCRTPALPLVTRCSQRGRHHLACWPGEGPRHDPRCSFHRLDPEMSGQGAYELSAIRETDTGTSIRFAAPLVSKPGEQRPAVDAAACPGLGRRSVGLLGLLHYLWDAAKLSAWSADSRGRSWGQVARALTEQAAHCTISRQPAESVLYVVPAYRPERAEANLAAFDAFLDTLRADRTQIRRGFVLGEIRDVRRSKFGWSYQLGQLGRQRLVFVSDQLDAKLRRSYRNAFSDAAADAGGLRVALFYIERSSGGFATAVDAAVMLTNSAYIPADSSYEVRMADALSAAGRSFLKPLTFDSGTGDAVTASVFPDFVLVDEPAAYVEVWGLPGREDYEHRKAEKIAHYQRTASKLIEWTVTDPIPTRARLARPAGQHRTFRYRSRT